MARYTHKNNLVIVTMLDGLKIFPYFSVGVNFIPKITFPKVTSTITKENQTLVHFSQSTYTYLYVVRVCKIYI